MLSLEEQKIVEYGKANGKTPADVTSAIASYRASQDKTKVEEKKSFLSGVKEDWAKRKETAQTAVGKEQGFLSKTLQVAGQAAGFVGDVVGEGVKSIGRGISAITPDIIEKPVVGGAKAVGVGILNTSLGQAGLKAIQEGVESYNKFKAENPEAAGNLEAVVNIASILPIGKGVQVAGKGAVRGGEAVAGAVKEGAERVAGSVASTVKRGSDIVGDIVPTKKGILNREVTTALDLTRDDTKKIFSSTGNQVGEFIAQRNLIGKNVDDTIVKLNKHADDNFNAVRNEISKVTTEYTDAPRYKEAIDLISKKTKDVAGLEAVNAELAALAKIKKPTLSNIQRVKELMDERFNLYSVMGDVQQGIEKSGLANIRKDLKKFIETEVKTNTGADIAKLNKEVATSKTILDAVQNRLTRDATRATVNASDIITFLTGSGFATPVGGVVAVLAKKLYQSPNFKLKFAKWLNKKTPSQKAKIFKDIKAGKTPKGINVKSK